LTGLHAGKALAQADQPAPRTDANSKLAHQQMVENLKKGRIDVYFAGDSITRRWRATDYPKFLENWKENFFGWNAANFGWGGDTIQNILWRMQNGELDGVHPKVIVLLAGTNNVGNTPASDTKVADISKGLKALLETLREKAPKATILVMGILPRNDGAKPTAVMASIDKINDNIAKLADGKIVRYLNINDKLADKDGKLFDGMTGDRLHLSLKGYQVWADALKPLFTELLGPPAKEDHAPPPTGDPSAAKKKGSSQSGPARPTTVWGGRSARDDDIVGVWPLVNGGLEPRFGRVSETGRHINDLGCALGLALSSGHGFAHRLAFARLGVHGEVDLAQRHVFQLEMSIVIYKGSR
jgi:lysophospholipase L1-like esterase